LIGYLLGYKPAKPPGITLATRLRTVIHLGDEDMGLKPDKLSCVDLFPHVPLALRQYALPPAASSASDGNVFQIPLGYMVGYLRDNKEEPTSHTSVQYARWSLARNSSARSMKWSFVGGFHGTGKSEREHAIKVTIELLPKHEKLNFKQLIKLVYHTLLCSEYGHAAAITSI
jgi:hypothetical protein